MNVYIDLRKVRDYMKYPQNLSISRLIELQRTLNSALVSGDLMKGQDYKIYRKLSKIKTEIGKRVGL